MSHETLGLTNAVPSRGTVTRRGWAAGSEQHPATTAEFSCQRDRVNGAENKILFFHFQLSELYSVPSGMYSFTIALRISATDVPVETVKTLITALQSLSLPASTRSRHSQLCS